MATSISLCLACSASLPPRKEDSHVFYTACCSNPICPRCISINPRLTRYHPCLRCLGGVKAVTSRSRHPPQEPIESTRRGITEKSEVNVDGAVRDEDIFVVDDDEDGSTDSESGEDPSDTQKRNPTAQSVNNISPSLPSDEMDDHLVTTNARAPESTPLVHPPISPTQASSASPSEQATNRTGAQRYYIRPEDTLLGISLRLGVDSRALCRLNNLSPSTLRTTPHLLHTRSFLVLPPSAHPLPPSGPASPAERASEDEHMAQFAIERAETRFQAMTKVTDRDVARAYVALAGLSLDENGDGDSADPRSGDKEYTDGDKLKQRPQQVERVMPAPGSFGQGERSQSGMVSLEGRAMDQYFDDEEWETRERTEGRKVAIPSFPFLSGSNPVYAGTGGMPSGEKKPWWRWRSE